MNVIDLFIYRVSETKAAQNTIYALNRGRYLKISKKCELSWHYPFWSCAKLKHKQCLDKSKRTTICFHQYQAETRCFWLAKDAVCRNWLDAPQKVNIWLRTIITIVIEGKQDISSTINESRLDDDSITISHWKGYFDVWNEFRKISKLYKASKFLASLSKWCENEKVDVPASARVDVIPCWTRLPVFFRPFIILLHSSIATEELISFTASSNVLLRLIEVFLINGFMM